MREGLGKEAATCELWGEAVCRLHFRSRLRGGGSQTHRWVGRSCDRLESVGETNTSRAWGFVRREGLSSGFAGETTAKVQRRWVYWHRSLHRL
ncbi:hypothetical protein CKA32_003612 [Geitlerinema sp. FC II]|nr:hypothetical protein CKA32_003612 [Geitlerinema sp. FC II]